MFTLILEISIKNETDNAGIKNVNVYVDEPRMNDEPYEMNLAMVQKKIVMVLYQKNILVAVEDSI